MNTNIENAPDTPQPDPRRLPHPRSPQYKFTPEELRVVRECNKESFYQRCLPLGTVLGLATYYGVKTGHLKANPRFGALPKVTVSVIVGYFVGKFSYQNKCAEKLMQLPNSYVGEMLRQRRRGHIQENLDPSFGPSMSLAPFSSMNATEKYSDLNPNSSLDLDTTRPQYDGLDESFRPSLDNNQVHIYEEDMPPMQKNTTTYDELRRQNREEYQQKRMGTYKEPPKPAASVPSSPSEVPHSGRKNKYGDDFE